MSETSAALKTSGGIPIPQLYVLGDDAYRSISGRAVATNEYAQNIIGWGKTAGGVYVPIAVNANGGVQTELPAAAELSDSTGNPTTPMVGAALMVYDSTWKRVRGAAAPSDADVGTGAIQMVPWLHNGTNFDRQRNNTTGTPLASAARTALAQSPAQTNHNAKAVVLFLDVTARPGGGQTLRIGVDLQDPTSGKWVTIGDVTFPDATGTYAFVLGFGATETIAKSEMYVQGVGITRTWRCFGDPSTADPWTYSVGSALIV